MAKNRVKNVCSIFSVLDLRKSPNKKISKAKKGRTFVFFFISGSWLFAWIKFSVCMHTRCRCCCWCCCICFFSLSVVHSSTLHLLGETTKKWLTYNFNSTFVATVDELERKYFVRSVASDWNGNYDTNRPKTNFKWKFRFNLLRCITSKLEAAQNRKIMQFLLHST